MAELTKTKQRSQSLKKGSLFVMPFTALRDFVVNLAQFNSERTDKSSETSLFRYSNPKTQGKHGS
ncbi:MAG: hypothetical protein KME60_03515 [Cyanomargarita calcarea GSE-NOS-MK-12-04C]|uniref:Uncharacterized protein n=1 Tax=Cyanomargarita calcarea GSE-NOS-MK-12-04C TaxID=2839659 RepID=A0A951UT78_9CYAN|nr:hypothetical protein [Cyanomargarita calcarea GSE-NOS-MK-12-04C]